MEYRTTRLQDGVSEATKLITQLVLAKRGITGAANSAIRAVAKDCQISPAQVRRFYQPSRIPKDVGVGVWLRIAAAYRRFIEEDIRRLEHDLHRMESLGNFDPRTTEDLAAEAQNLIRRIKQHL